MHWQLKCLALYALELAPFGDALHGLAQRRLTKRFFHPIDAHHLKTPQFHVDNLADLGCGPATALEFGSGRNLMTALLISQAGTERVYCYDIAALATVEQINATISGLSALVPGEWPRLERLDDLGRLYRIEYRAPADARVSGLASGQVDFACSTATNEHIPPDDLAVILRELRRVARPGARFSFIIDYHDHYASADRSITPYNFYRYSDRLWRWFNPGNHYQNRLRHSDYLAMFEDLGFSVLKAERVVPEGSEALLARQPIDPRFAGYSREDMLTVSGRFLLTH